VIPRQIQSKFILSTYHFQKEFKASPSENLGVNKPEHLRSQK
jgi:hypothetical protein